MANQTTTDKSKLTAPLLADWVIETLYPFRRQDLLAELYPMPRPEAQAGQPAPWPGGMNLIQPIQPDNGQRELIPTPLPAPTDESQGSLASGLVPFRADNPEGGNGPGWLDRYPAAAQSLAPADDPIAVLHDWGLMLPGDTAMQEAFGTSPQTVQEQGSKGYRKLLARLGGNANGQTAAPGEALRGSGYGNGDVPTGVGNPRMSEGEGGSHLRPAGIYQNSLESGGDYNDAAALQGWENRLKNTTLRPLPYAPSDQELRENSRKAEEYDRINPFIETQQGRVRKYPELRNPQPAPEPKPLDMFMDWLLTSPSRLGNEFRKLRRHDGPTYIESMREPIRQETEATKKRNEFEILLNDMGGLPLYDEENYDAFNRGTKVGDDIALAEGNKQKKEFAEKYGKYYPKSADFFNGLAREGLLDALYLGTAAATKNKMAAEGVKGAASFSLASDDFMEKLYDAYHPQNQEEWEALKETMGGLKNMYAAAEVVPDLVDAASGKIFSKFGGTARIKQLAPGSLRPLIDKLEEKVGREKALKYLMKFGVVQAKEHSKAAATQYLQENEELRAGITHDKRSLWEIIKDDAGPVTFNALLGESLDKTAADKITNKPTH